MAASVTKDNVVDHKFVILFRKIKLILDKPIECSIMYEYDLFSSNEVWTRSFTINAEDSNSQEIPSNCCPEYQFSTSNPKIKEHLNSNPLKVQVFDKDTPLGNATIDLGRLFSPEADKMWFGLRYMVETPIFGIDNLNTNEIGKIESFVVLETEDCIKCKYCNEYFKETTIKKHAIHNKKCNICYTDEDFKSLEDMAKERLKKRRSQRHQNTYKPEERAKKYKNDPKNPKHDPAKRRASFEKERIKAKEEEKKWRELEREDVVDGFKKDEEIHARAFNQENFEMTKLHFKEDCQRIEGKVAFPAYLSMEKERLIHDMEDLYKVLEEEIDDVVEKARDVKDIEEAEKIFATVNATRKKDREEAEEDFKNDREPKKHILHYQWLERTLANNSELKKIAKHIGLNTVRLGVSKEEIKKKLGE